MKEYSKYVNKIIMDDRGTKESISMIFLPITYREDILGVVTVQSLKADIYDYEDIKRLRVIANYIAISLKNSDIYHKMQKTAAHDSLTGFLTKRELIKVGNAHVKEFEDFDTPFCIMMLDIDAFKVVNDMHGHINGDKILKHLGTLVPKQVRSSDYIGRYGGDEFVIICPDTTADIAEKIASRICKAVEAEEFLIDESTSVPISLSVGIHEFSAENKSFLRGVDIADSKMYLCKKSKN